jgi:hypothetical protein
MCPDCNPIAYWPRLFKGVEVCGSCGRPLDASDFIVISKGAPPRQHDNPFGRGVRLDDRGLPYLDPKGDPLLLGESFNPKEYGEGPVVLVPEKERV